MSVSNENTEEALRPSLVVYTPIPADSAVVAAARRFSMSLACEFGSLLPLTCRQHTVAYASHATNEKPNITDKEHRPQRSR